MSLAASQYIGFGVSAGTQRQRALVISSVHAFAAWCLFGLLAAQVFVGGAYWLLSESDSKAKQAAAIAAGLESSVTNREKSQAVLRLQLDQVRGWERLSAARLPASAVLAAIEQSIPPELALQKVRVAVGPVNGTGDLRIPRGYTLEIVGWQQTGDQVEIGRWTTTLQKNLPTGTTLQPLEFRPGTPNAFTVRLSMPSPAAEDLQRLGMRNIPISAQ